MAIYHIYSLRAKRWKIVWWCLSYWYRFSENQRVARRFCKGSMQLVSSRLRQRLWAQQHALSAKRFGLMKRSVYGEYDYLRENRPQKVTKWASIKLLFCTLDMSTQKLIFQWAKAAKISRCGLKFNTTWKRPFLFSAINNVFFLSLN
jgi:hypothetical protein